MVGQQVRCELAGGGADPESSDFITPHMHWMARFGTAGKALLIFGITLGSLATPAWPVKARSSMSAEQSPMPIGQFKRMLVDVLEENPEIAQQAVARAEAKAAQAAELATQKAARDLLKRVSSSPAELPILGRPAAATSIVEAVDYRCSYCRLMHPRLKQLLAARPDVRIAVLMTPILGADSERLARFALAAGQQDRFEATHDALFASDLSVPVSDADLSVIASKVGVDWPRAKAAMQSPVITRAMERMHADWESLNKPGTPFIIVGDKVFAGAADVEDLLHALPTVASSEPRLSSGIETTNSTGSPQQ